MSEWIKCSDTQPPKDVEFLGFENNRIFVCSFRMGCMHECCRSEWPEEVNPSHWMPLPEVPKE